VGVFAVIPLVLLFAVAIVVSALLVPLRVIAIGSPGNPYRIVLVWLFGAVTVPLRDGRRSGGEKNGRRGTRSTEGKARRKRRAGRRWRIPENPRAVIPAMMRLAGAVLRTVRFTGGGELVFGLIDPADTGMVWGRLAPLVELSLPDEADIRLRPSFLGVHLSFSGSVTVETVPFRIVVPVVRFIVSSEGRTLIRTARRKA
jgi:hypothetical protein